MIHTPLHPLLDEDEHGNKLNDHYDAGEEPAILRLEKEEDINSLIAWSRITAKKYLLRLGYKDDEEKELKKHAAYKRYNEMLTLLIIQCPACGEMTAYAAYKKLSMEWRY